MKPVKKTIMTLIFLMVFLIGHCQKKEKPLASSPSMGTTSKTTIKRLATTVEPNRKFSYAERELDYLMHIWKGEYDNVEQLDFDKIQRKDDVKKTIHERVHISVRQFQNSNFGVGAVYVEAYRNNDPTIITRKVVYQLLPDDKEKAIRVKVFHFKNKKPVLSANREFGEIANLTPNSDKLIVGCEMLLRRVGNGFVAKTMNKTCIKENRTTTDYQFGVTEDGFSFQEVAYVSNERLPDDMQVTAYTLEKARCFTCMIDFPNDTNGRPTETKYYIDMYDQGGSYTFEYPDGRKMLFGMRNTWSFGMHRETFVIYLIDTKTKKTLVYSWGEPGADRIGFNSGWIRAQCDLKTPRNVKLQQELRPKS